MCRPGGAKRSEATFPPEDVSEPCEGPFRPLAIPAVRFYLSLKPTHLRWGVGGWMFCQITFWAVGVLQAEAGFVAFGHLGPVERQQVVVGEHLDAVVVPKEGLRLRPKDSIPTQLIKLHNNNNNNNTGCPFMELHLLEPFPDVAGWRGRDTEGHKNHKR